jgi:hypothetical protein
MKSSSSSQDGVSSGGCLDGARPRDGPASPVAGVVGTLGLAVVTLGRCRDGFGGMKSSSLAFVASGACPDVA